MWPKPLKQLLQSYVEQGLDAPPQPTPSRQSAGQLPKLEGRLAIDSSHVSNADLFELLEPWATAQISQT